MSTSNFFVAYIRNDETLNQNCREKVYCRINILYYSRVIRLVQWIDESVCGDARFAVPLLEFRFEFVLPKSRKSRTISVRDVLGRIIRSEVPDLAVIGG